MPNLALRSQRVVTPEGVRAATILIENGRIAALLPHDADIAEATLVDVGSRAILPGVIDPHVHINEPGRTDWEGFDTATRAALAGGLTTLVDMPLNSAPVTTSVANLEIKRAATKGQLHTNVGFWGGVVPGNAAEIEPLIAAGVLGFKAFLTHSGIDDFPNATEEDLRRVMPILARHQLPLLVHCELSVEDDAWKQNDHRSYPNYLASRPKEWEDKAVAMMIRLCEEFRCPVHIVHLSSANSIAPIAAAKARGLHLTVETGQHYLYFNAEDIADGQTQFKCAPPIREKANNDQLWAALQSGIIDFVATDHSPAPPDLKQLESGDFTTAWGGIASLQLALPVLWTAARQRGATLPDLTRWLSENPAQLIGQSHQKGRIAVGYDADLIVLSPEKSFVVHEKMIQHKHKVSPYICQELWGVVEQTFLKGKQVYEHPTFTHLNQGEIITRS
ncbi:allantoinase AllB [Hymenobacter sp. BT770]|uniref:allantoinase AllB n=1 Tax=Hymenobacter sp. BT770 TaxID=2886942 RepID=UPI001D101CCF|nr:allantoinase AllB [Hymenobacter sp. BT770]MCC3153846.1 allantoinase AllB [Hymenobacter sp. BT770]MDO3415990.1 allantoinase AllB [Hymenobacter sp. BT770]